MKPVLYLLTATLCLGITFFVQAADDHSTKEDTDGGLVHHSPSQSLPFFIPEQVLPWLRPEHFQTGNLAEADEITEIIDSAAIAGGKRLRPLLCYLTGGLAGLYPQQLVEMACLAEWTHGASLVHDDIIDGSETRRERPTLWAMTSVKKAVLLGDWLLAKSMRKALETGVNGTAESILEIVEGMVWGEFLQDRLISRGTYTEQDWEEVALQKTGLLFAWTCRTAATCAKMPDAIIQLYDRFGRDFAIIYQILDDVGDTDEFGEINLVHLRAATQTGQSPFSSNIEAAQIAQAANATLDEVQVQITSLEQSVNTLAEATATVLEQHVPPSLDVNLTTLRNGCHRSLLEIAEVLQDATTHSRHSNQP